MSVLLETSAGDLVIDTLFEQAPEPSLNFLKLCKLKYYNDSEFFFIQSSFIARLGNPHSPTTSYPADTCIYGLCNPSTSTPSSSQHTLSASSVPSTTTSKLTHARRGAVSFTVAKGRYDKQYASQFFITLTDGLNYLDDAGHVIFGYVTEGLNSTLNKLANSPVDSSMRPLRLLRVRHTIILHDPFDDPITFDNNNNDPPSPKPYQIVPPDRLPSSSEGEGSVSDSNNDERRRDVEKVMKEQRQLEEEVEAKSRAQVLEMVGDIAHADMKPPENVLFVCKLNPHTDENGLEIIFSRFGPCKANLIKDSVSGQSLCYAFVEFDRKEMCEAAYFKMDNALIDDRLIRVDFSQSVSKLWFQYHPRRPHQLGDSANSGDRTILKDNRLAGNRRRNANVQQSSRFKKRKTRFDVR